MALNGGRPVLETCLDCRHRAEHAFCNLSQEALQSLDQISFALPYPERAVLFSENDLCRGVFLLCSGQAKLSTTSPAGKTLLLRTVDPGEVLGLSSALAGSKYDVTAAVTMPSMVRFVKRDEFVQFLRTSGEATMHAVQTLGREYERALENLRTLAWLSTATARVAQLLLHLDCDGNNHGAGNRLPLTHCQIAEMTATTRETVSRLLIQLRKDRIISLRGSDLLIRDRAALERMAG